MNNDPDYERRDKMLKAQPHVRELGDGSFRVEMAGIVGVGPTIDKAVRDLSEKVAVAMRPPEA
ncbi:MAG: hypothetical protein JWO38_3156 [Gemmataceae bacterium]|nr:hypothetical protein [Gemmataceae bacterium]